MTRLLSKVLSAKQSNSTLVIYSKHITLPISAASLLPHCWNGLQGLAAAAATREAAKRKGHSAEDQGQPKRARKVPVISHEVAVPKGYEVKDLKEELHGVLLSLPSALTLEAFGIHALACVHR